MEKQEGIFEVDYRGRKAEKLGLQPANEIVVAILEESRRVYRSFANYQIGIVDVEMKKLSGADKSAELGRLWQDANDSASSIAPAIRALPTLPEE